MQASAGSDVDKESKSKIVTSVTGAEIKKKSPSKSSHHDSKKNSSQKSSSGKKESEGHKKKNSVSSSKQQFEPCVFGKSKVWLPQEIIHNPGVFQEVVSMNTWEERLTDEDRNKLFKLLPGFPENNDDEQSETIRQLFNGDNFRFGNPLRQFERDLIQGSYGVDSVEKHRAWERLQKEECQKQDCHRLQTMLPEVLIKRQELLEVVQFTSPSEYIKKPSQPMKKSKVDIQSNLKYEKLLEDLSLEMGESFLSDEDSDKTVYTDEEDDSGSPQPWEDRLHNLFDSPPRKMHSSVTPKPSSNEINGTEESKTKAKEKCNIVTEKDYMHMLERMQIVKEDSIEHPEFIVSHITLRDIINRTYPMKLKSPEEISSLKRKRKKEKEDVKVKKKKRTPTTSPKPSTPVSLVSSQEIAVGLEVPSSPESVTTIQPEAPVAPSKPENAQPALSGSSEVQSKVQYQVPHSFFALLRKYFNMAMNHQLWVSDLQEKVSIWEKSPVSALCPWRPLQSTWSKVVENTLFFLSMEEQGRLVNYLEEEDAWMWPDPMSVPNDHLTKLFKRWLDLMLRVQPVASPVLSREGTVVIPEPRMYTDYTVKTSLDTDVQKFREQELQRFAEPHKPFTYFQHGYESVVGPVKGITSKDPLPASKGREHSLLVSDRPSYVTILSLVRDAVARLPNGEGTKIEICQLLRESQYIAPNSEGSLLAATSGALDRLHNEKDPSVKFDAARKLWVYLHRNRSMRDFERIQMERLIANRSKKSASKQRQAANQGRPQTPFSSGDFQTDLAQSSSESSSPSLESPSRCSPASARSMSPRIPSLSPRSAGLGIDVKGLDLSKNPGTLAATYTVERPLTGKAHGVMKESPAPDNPQAKVVRQGGVFDPNLSTIQSLISESLIKSQLLKKTTQRSKTPPASLGRSNTAVPSGAQLLPPGSIQRSLSIPASWPHISRSAAGDLIPSDVLLTGNPVKLQAVKAQLKDTPRQNTSAPKKGMDASSKARANSPRTGCSDKKSTHGVKSKSKGEKSKSSKAASAEKKSPTVQLKSGAITVTLPSSALKGQTVRSILASAASITIGKTSQGEEQSHPTVQAVRKRLLAEKNQVGIKTKQSKTEVKVPVRERSDLSGPSVPAKIDPKPTSLPTIILRPTAPAFIGQAQPKSKDMTAVSTAQISSQPVALMGPKPAGIITGMAPSPSAVSNKQVPLSLVVSGSSSKVTPATANKPAPYLQQGNFPLPSLAPGQNIILQMPDGSKFVTSIPAASAASTMQTKKQGPGKLMKTGSSSEDSKEKVTGVSVIQPTMGRVLNPQQKKRTLPSPQPQARPVVTTTASNNPYDFDDDLEATKPIMQTFKQSLPSNVIMKSSSGTSNPVLTITSTASALQGIALNLVTKHSGQTRKQGVAVATTGVVTQRPRVVTTESSTIKERPSSGQVTPSSNKVVFSNQEVPQAVDFSIGSQNVMSSKGTSGDKSRMSSQKRVLPDSSVIRSKPVGPRDQEVKSSKKVLPGSQDVVTSKSSVIVSGVDKVKVSSALQSGYHSQTAVKQVTTKISERQSPSIPARVAATPPSQASFIARGGSVTHQRNPSNVSSGMRVSHRPHSSPGILRKSQDSSKKHNPAKTSLRTSKSLETSFISEQTLKPEVKGDFTGSGSRPDQKKPVKGLSKQVIILQKPETFSRSMPSHMSETFTSRTGVKSLKGASEESSSVVGNSSLFTIDSGRSDAPHELEGSVKTAKLIKSQEKAEAVSGGISKQDGQDQT